VNEEKPGGVRRRLGARKLAGMLFWGLLCLPAAYYLVLRWGLTNFHTVVEGAVYRSAQPSAGDLRRWTARHGLKTVVNLRGEQRPPIAEAQRRAAAELGLELIEIEFTAVEQPTLPGLRRLIAAIETAKQPMLLHCRDGSDRTGVASVLAAMAVGGEDYDTARKQLSWRYLHVNSNPEHMVGLLMSYEDHCREAGTARGGWPEFREWATSRYCPYYYRVEIEAPARLEAQAGGAVAAEVTITNRSPATLPAADPAKTFNIAVFSGDSSHERPDELYGRRTRLPLTDIPPGGSVRLEKSFKAPARPGVYIIHFDLVEERRTWFAKQGSPVPTCELVVSAAEPAAIR
jgi:protein tyrosine/serine phosphatase